MKTFWIVHIDDFLFEKKVNDGLRPGSLRDYQQVFNHLLDNEFLDPLDFSTFTENRVKMFLASKLQSNNWASATYNKTRKNLKVYCDFLVKNGYIPNNPFASIPNRKADKKLPRYLDTQKLWLFHRVLNSTFSQKDFISQRNKTIFHFYLYTGLRLYELINLDIWDINFLESYALVRNGKGGKDRIVPLCEELKHHLVEYYFQRVKYKNLVPLFPTYFGNRLQHREIYTMLWKIKKQLPFDVTPHMLRHTFASHCIQKGVNVYNVSRVLGHSSLKTTEIYLHTTIEDVTTQINSVRLYR